MTLLRLTDRGLYCEAGDFFVDPWGAVDRAIVTHAHGDHVAWGCRSYLTASDGVGVLRERLGDAASIEGIGYGLPRHLSGVEEALEAGLFSTAHLLHDSPASLNAAELARRQFREIARVAGLIFQGYPGANQSVRQLQASSELLYDVLARYDPDNLLLLQAHREVLERQIAAPATRPPISASGASTTRRSCRRSSSGTSRSNRRRAIPSPATSIRGSPSSAPRCNGSGCPVSW